MLTTKRKKAATVKRSAYGARKTKEGMRKKGKESELSRSYRSLNNKTNALKRTMKSSNLSVIEEENYPVKEIKQKQMENDNNNDKCIYVEENELS